MATSQSGISTDGTVMPEEDPGYETEDSGFDDQSVLTQSLRSSIYAHKEENGRRYHAFKEGAYFMPNDDIEQERMSMQHRAMFLASGCQILYAPIPENPQNILDLGTGIGIWAIDIADRYPEALVTGVDLSPIQPNWVPPNVKFEIDDVEDTWTWPRDHFDLVHSQLMLAGSIADIGKYFTQAFTHCKPGGYIQLNEVCTRLRSDHVPIPEDSQITKWCGLMREGIVKMGRHLDLDFEQLGEMLREVGFVDVVVKHYKVPLGSWPADPRLKQAGQLQQVAMLDGVESLTLAIFTRCLNWSVDEVQVMLAHVRKEFLKKKTYTYWPAAVIYGRKPSKPNKPDEA